MVRYRTGTVPVSCMVQPNRCILIDLGCSGLTHDMKLQEKDHVAQGHHGRPR